MKKLVSLILALAMVLCAVSFASADETYRVAMITDSGDITDQSFNQTTYEACKAFCEANGVDFNYFKPTGDSDAERIAQVEAAIDEGYNVIVMPGYLFAATIGECQPMYPDVKFIALDVSEYDLTSNGVDLSNASNLFSAVYQEELSGYMAGYAAVKMGYKKLGFLGGMEVPAVQRFGTSTAASSWATLTSRRTWTTGTPPRAWKSSSLAAAASTPLRRKRLRRSAAR